MHPHHRLPTQSLAPFRRDLVTAAAEMHTRRSAVRRSVRRSDSGSRKTGWSGTRFDGVARIISERCNEMNLSFHFISFLTPCINHQCVDSRLCIDPPASTPPSLLLLQARYIARTAHFGLLVEDQQSCSCRRHVGEWDLTGGPRYGLSLEEVRSIRRAS